MGEKSGTGKGFRRLRLWRSLLLLLLVFSTAGVLMALMVVGLYTEPHPQEFASTTLSREEIQDLERRLALFQQALRQERNPGPLALRAEEINALLEVTPPAKSLKDKLRLSIQDDALTARVSLPLRTLRPRWLGNLLQGRFVNAEAGLSVALHHGQLYVRPQWVRVKGRRLPEFLMQRLRRQNLAWELNADARASMAMEKLERLEVANGKLLIYPAEFEGWAG